MRLAFPEAVSVKFLTNLGLYLHIPFCKKKCRYCDFYSACSDEGMIDRYTEALIKKIKQWGGEISRPIDTVYLGGGTPSLLAHRLPDVLNAVKESFEVTENCETTLELNPSGNTQEILSNAKRAGVNRLSIGLQSGNDAELELLGRTHSFKEGVETFKTARNMGFSNISLDLMIGLPHSGENDNLKESLEKIISLNPEHISAYILKIEEKTAFYKDADSLNLPDDDSVAKQYLYMSEILEKNGYSHYEISNFAKIGFESRHNLKYWLLEDYLGIGPSAHSFYNGKRFYYPRDIKAFMSGNIPVADGKGGDLEEYIMLRLRLKEGFSSADAEKKYNIKLPNSFYDKCKSFEKAGLLEIKSDRYSLTNNGFLLSNSIISELLEEIGEVYENS